MTFFFAWVNPGQNTFEPGFMREDEEVLAVEIAQEEGDFASMRIEIRNPRAGLLSLTRKRWAWLSCMDGEVATPLFFGRLIGLPEELADDLAVLSFIAKPLNFQAAKSALAETLRDPQYYDPLLIEKNRRNEPDTVLEARPAVWHIDRTSHAVTISHILHGSGAAIDFGTDPIFESLRCRYAGAPQRKVKITATVEWTQYGTGSIEVTFKGVNSYTGDGLLEQWPRTGQNIGGGWSVLDGFAKDAYSSANSENIANDDGSTQYALYLWTIGGRVTCGYEAIGSTPSILAWAKATGQDRIYKADETAWCGLWMAYVALQAGWDVPLNPLAARNWLNFGQAVEKPALGDVLVFSWGSSGFSGHVGLYVGEDAHAFHVLGGNQSDRVMIKRIAKTRLLGIRRCPWRINQPAAVRPVVLSANGTLSTNEA